MPNWKKVIVSGSDASLNSLVVINGVTGSLLGTASWANNATTASRALQANTASYALTSFPDNQIISGAISAIVDVNPTQAFRITSGSSTYFVVSGSGNIGIGTTVPLNRLHVYNFVTGSTTADRTTPVDVLTLETENISAVEYDGFGQIINFRGVTYNDPTKKNLGRIIHKIRDASAGATFGTSLHFELLPNATASVPVERVVFDPNGNVGIGTISPSATLNVSSSVATSVLRIDTAGGVGLFVSGSGFTGMGTTNTAPYSGLFPGQLVIDAGTGAVDGAFITTNNTNAAELILTKKNSANNFGSLLIQHSGSTGDAIAVNSNVNISTGTGGVNSFKVTTAGNGYFAGIVGIGTTAPSSILDASVSSGATSGFRFKGFSDASTPYLLSLGTQTYQDIFQIKSVNGLVTMGIIGAIGSTPDLAFQTNTTERMRILSGGNIGIGTTAPTSRLHVSGTTGGLFEVDGVSAATLFYITASGNIGINTTNPQARLQVSGSENTVNIKGSGSAVFSVDGTSGRLFQVDDSLTGSLFSVNTAAGLPIIEAFSDNTVRIGQFGQRALFVSQSKVGVGKESLLNGTLDVSGSVTVTGSLNVTGSITGSLFGTASWALNVLTASFVAGTVTSASYALSASYAMSSSVAFNASNAISASYAQFANTASSADNFNVRNTLTVTTIVAQVITSSTDFVTGSTRFGSIITNTHQFTGSVSISGSLNVTGTGITGSLFGTASYSSLALTASIADNAVTASRALNANTASFATSAANATTASFATNAISASYALSASYATGSGFASSASFATQAANASSASFATSAANATTASFATNTISASYALSASYATGSGFASSASFALSSSIASRAVTASYAITASYLSGSVDSASFATTASFTFSASIASRAVTASYAITASYLSGSVDSASYAVTALTASRALNANTASFATSAANATTASYILNAASASYAQTASFLNPVNQTVTISGSLLISSSLATQLQVGSNILFITGSGNIGIGMTTPTGSTLTVNGNIWAVSLTGSLFGTASWATNVVSASYSTFAASSSYALTASHALNAGGGAGGPSSGAAYTHTQSTPATTWTVAHNLTNLYPVVTVYDFSGNVVVPQNISSSNANQTIITFSYGATGYATAVAAGISNPTSASYAATASVLLGAITSASYSATASVVLGSVTSASYAATSSFSRNFTVGSTFVFDQTLTDYGAVPSSIVGSNNVFTQATGSYTSAFIKYTAASASNARSGELIAVWNGGVAQFTDISTVDIGTTSAVTASAVIVTNDFQFNIQTNTAGWNIKSMATYI